MGQYFGTVLKVNVLHFILFIVSVILGFTYTETYPDEGPVMEVKSYENIEECHVDELLELMKEQVSSLIQETNLNIGCYLCFIVPFKP